MNRTVRELVDTLRVNSKLRLAGLTLWVKRVLLVAADFHAASVGMQGSDQVIAKQDNLQHRP